MPQQIELSADRSIQNTYAADGRKLFASATENNQPVSDGTRYYNGNLVFDINKELDYILFDEGRILHENGNFAFEYHLKDHLGSVRVAFVPTVNGKEVVQENAYYPFGATIADLSYAAPLSNNRYGYTGQEQLNDFDLNWYDYIARNYNPLIGRFNSIDPLAEKYYSISPYAYCGNNPIRYIDLRGDSISVAEEHREQFMSDIRNVYGDKADALSFNASGNLVLNGKAKDFTKGMSKDQKKAFNGLSKAMNDKQTTSIVYANTQELTIDGQKQSVDIVAEFGGGVYSKTDNMIVIAPNVGTVNVTLDEMQFVNGTIGIPHQNIQQNTTSTLFHEIGERNTTNINFRGGVSIMKIMQGE